MNILDSLTSHTICQFSSNLTDICFTQTSNYNHKKRISLTESAKPLYKMQYIMNKKINALKYFAFVTLQEVRKTSKSSKCTKQQYNKQSFLPKDNIVDLIASIECVFSKYYGRVLIEEAFVKLLKNKNDYTFRFCQIVENVLISSNHLNVTWGLQKIKQKNRDFERLDILTTAIQNSTMRARAQQLLMFAFFRMKEIIPKSNEDNSRVFIAQNQNQNQNLSQVKDQIENYALKSFKFIKYSQQYQKQKTQQQNYTHRKQNSISSINSIFSIDDIGSHPLTPSKTDKYLKRKVYLSTKKFNLSKSASRSNKQINSKALEPLIFDISNQPSILTKFQQNLNSDTFASCCVRPSREQHPDQLIKQIGDFADNLAVFRWFPLEEDIKSSRLPVSTTPVNSNPSKKKDSISGILTQSVKHKENIISEKSSTQSSQFRKTKNILKDEETGSKKIKSSCIDKKCKKFQRNSTQIYPKSNSNQASSKFFDFLKKQEKSSSTLMGNKLLNINKTVSCKSSFTEDNRPKIRNSINILGSRENTVKQLQECYDNYIYPRKVIRKFSPITTIRQKLKTNYK